MTKIFKLKKFKKWKKVVDDKKKGKDPNGPTNHLKSQTGNHCLLIIQVNYLISF